jgi:hypothetical protein
MKQLLICITSLAVLCASAFAKTIDLSEVPEPVRATIVANMPEKRIDEIVVRSLDGGKRYVARLDLQGDRKLRVYVSSDGTLQSIRRDLTFRQLPRRVRDTVRDALEDGGVVATVERRTRGSQIRYIIRIRPDDDDTDSVLMIVVTPDGKIIKSRENIKFDELSKRLRRVINSLLCDGWEIESIDRILDDGRTTYRVVIERPNGSRTAYTLSSRGRVIDKEDLPSEEA